MRMLDFKESRKNLENCIISRNSKSLNRSREMKRRDFVCDRAKIELEIGQLKPQDLIMSKDEKNLAK